IREGDIVTEINGKKIKDSHELLLMVASFHVGDRVSVKVLRGGREMVFNVTISERPERPEVASSRGKQDDLGLTVQDITPEIADYLGIPRKGGVIVTRVQSGSIAEEVGIQPYDIILQVNKVKIASTKDYAREMAKKQAKKSVMLLIKRGGAAFFVALNR
ncbi:MAG: PDZ domain-containing protein, partial [Syntrophales bacterium]|nr:PDZ domain-containing protein [Syntrophales bacterium]